MNAPTVAVVGVGLIGGSLGQAWRRSGAARVIGVARKESTIEAALAAEAIDEGTTDLHMGVAKADVVVFCTPVVTIVSQVLEAARAARLGTIFTDAGSTKGEICRALWRQLPDHCTFIGGHPMAGSEKTGVGAADPYLFENAAYCLTPPLGIAEDAPEMRVLKALVLATGARPIVLQPDTHDLIVAGISHVPHLVAVALVQAVAAAESEGISMLQLAAGGFRDTTRVAGGASDIWRDICLTNSSAIVNMIERVELSLKEIKQAVEAKNATDLVGRFDDARSVRQSVPARSRGILGSLFEITLILADEPGAIHTISGLLAKESINIADLEILRVREGEGGTVRLAFTRPDWAERAVELLQSNGFTARRL